MAAGPHEVQVGVIAQQRRVDATDGSRRYDEQEVSLNRAFRWPGKVSLDRRIGETGIHAAELRLDDARHQSARRLLGDWLFARRTHGQIALAEADARASAKEARLRVLVGSHEIWHDE